MIKFGRRFFFDKVYTKKNYTIPIIIGVVLLIAIITTFLVTRYFKDNTPKKKEIKAVLNQIVEIEVYNALPDKKQYFKELKNIEYNDFEIVYPEELELFEDLSECQNTEEITSCEKTLATSLGEYPVTIRTEKLNPKEYNVTLKVIDTTSPILELKEMTINEGKNFKINDFITSCKDNSKIECTYEYVEDYSKISKPGEYTIKILAKDSVGNESEIKETKLTIKKKKTQNNSSDKDNKPKCTYGDLKYSDAYVIATRIDNKECAISVEEANSLANKAAIEHNKKLAQEIKKAYLLNTIKPLNLEGQITYDIYSEPIFNSSNKGVVGYYLMAEANQTINGTTSTIARYFIDENGNRVWKINVLNLK